MLDDIAEQIRSVLPGRYHPEIAARAVTGSMVPPYTGRDRLRLGGDRLQPAVFAGDLHPLHGRVSGLTVVDEVCPVGLAEHHARLPEIRCSRWSDPADVIAVKMGEQHGVDVGGFDSGRAKLCGKVAAFGQRRGVSTPNGPGGGYPVGKRK